MATTTRSTKMTKEELMRRVVTYITDGKLDNYLETLVEASNMRRRVVRDRKMWENMDSLNKPGTKVRLVGTLRPKYILGYTGTVVDPSMDFPPKPGLIYVDIGTKVRRYGPVVGVPATCLEEA